MRVDVLINAKAGYANGTDLQKKIKKSLFRCDLHFHDTTSVAELKEKVTIAVIEGSEFIVVCGGDGTLNAVLEPLMQFHESQAGQNAVKTLPALCIIPVGTANDLATKEGLSRKIERASRAILDGGVKFIDVLEISADKKTAYMITNGGIGIPAQTAQRANVLRTWISDKADDPRIPRFAKSFFKSARQVVKIAGPKIYELLLIGDVTRWNHDDWEVDVHIAGKTSFSTQAPFILINNQPSVGGKFTPAPLTSNSDGTFNVLVVKPTALVPQVRAILDIRFKKIPKLGFCSSFETESVKLKARDAARPMTFFGDGEIIHRDARELNIRCIHPGIGIVTLTPNGAL